MEPSTGDSGLDSRNTDSSSATELQNAVEPTDELESFEEKDLTVNESMYLLGEEFYHIQWLYRERKVIELEKKINDKDILIKQMAEKICKQEQTILAHNLRGFKNRDEQIKNKLAKIREKAAERLGIETLDGYLVDDDTFKLTHEDDL